MAIRALALAGAVLVVVILASDAVGDKLVGASAPTEVVTVEQAGATPDPESDQQSAPDPIIDELDGGRSDCRVTTYQDDGDPASYGQGVHDVRGRVGRAITSIDVSMCLVSVCMWDDGLRACQAFEPGRYGLDENLVGKVGFLSVGFDDSGTGYTYEIADRPRPRPAGPALEPVVTVPDPRAPASAIRAPRSVVPSAPSAIGPSCSITRVLGTTVLLTVANAPTGAVLRRDGGTALGIGGPNVTEVAVPAGRQTYRMLTGSTVIAECGTSTVTVTGPTPTAPPTPVPPPPVPVPVPVLPTPIPPTTTAPPPVRPTQPTPPARPNRPAPLTNPNSCGVTLVNGRPVISWSGATGASEYRLWRNGKVATKTGATSFTDTKARKRNRTYEYAVASIGLPANTRVDCGSVRIPKR